MLYILLFFLPLSLGQLILGPCPVPPKYVKDLDLERYAGRWHVVAQSRHHVMGAADCQRVNYIPGRDGLGVQYTSHSKYPTNEEKFDNGTLDRERGKSSGELQLKLDTFPRRFQFRVLHVEYPEVAVEYTCLGGALSYLASITVLQRHPPAASSNLHSVLQDLRLSEVIPKDLKEEMLLINHSDCDKKTS